MRTRGNVYLLAAALSPLTYLLSGFLPVLPLYKSGELVAFMPLFLGYDAHVGFLLLHVALAYALALAAVRLLRRRRT